MTIQIFLTVSNNYEGDIEALEEAVLEVTNYAVNVRTRYVTTNSARRISLYPTIKRTAKNSKGLHVRDFAVTIFAPEKDSDLLRSDELRVRRTIERMLEEIFDGSNFVVNVALQAIEREYVPRETGPFGYEDDIDAISAEQAFIAEQKERFYAGATVTPIR